MRSRLKSVPGLVLLVKRLKVWREYARDAAFFTRHFLDADRGPDSLEYDILLLAHSLEKGLSRPDRRPFGLSKAQVLARRIVEAQHRGVGGRSATRLALGVLREWVSAQLDLGVAAAELAQVVDLLGRGDLPDPLPGGSLTVNCDPDQWRGLPLPEFLRSRRSVRRFSGDEVSDADVLECVALAQSSPSACNRQMVHFFAIEDPVARRRLHTTLHGTSGIEVDRARYGVVTFDVASLSFYGERNQGYLNAGLFAMSLVLAFHWKGIGACLLQVGNTSGEERELSAALRLPASHRIAVAIAYGRRPEVEVIPASVRREVSEISAVIR